MSILYHTLANKSRRKPCIFNEIVRCTMKSSRCSDEIFGLRLQMKLNPPPLTLRSKISSRSDFIHDSGFIPAKADLVEKSTHCLDRQCVLFSGRGSKVFSHSEKILSSRRLRASSTRLSRECELTHIDHDRVLNSNRLTHNQQKKNHP